MIRPFTCLCVLLAGGAGLYVYQSKHDAQLLDREIARTVKQADLARDRAGVLRAEYTLLNDPTRLAELAAAHLPALKTTAPTQFTTWTEFEKRLPPVGAPAVEAAPLEPDAPTAKLPEPVAAPAPVPVAETKPETSKPVVAARPSGIPALPPAVLAAAAAPRPAPTPPTPTVAPRSAAWPTPHPAVAPVSLTASLPPAAPQYAASQVAAPQYAAPQYVAPATPARPAPRTMPTYTPSGGSTAEVMARIAHGGSAEPTAPVVTSALGMARSIAPPPAAAPAAGPSVWQPGRTP